MVPARPPNRSSSDDAYRATGIAPSITTSFRLVARLRIIDSVLIPGAVPVGLAVATVLFMPSEVRLLLLGFALAFLLASLYLWARLLRPCVIECPFPYRTIQISLGGDRERQHSIDVERIARVITLVEIANDTAIHHVVFELTDGERVPLIDDINFFWGEAHAEKLAEHVRAYLTRVGEAAGRTV